MLPPALSLMAVMFPPEERPQALGDLGDVRGRRAGAGADAGRRARADVGWQAVFLVNVPSRSWSCRPGTRCCRSRRGPVTPPLDLLGAALSILGLAGVVFALIEGADAGWTSRPVLAAGAIGVAAPWASSGSSSRAAQPLFDVRVAGPPVVAAGAAAILATYIAFLGILFLLPQYLQYVQDRLVLGLGALLSPLGVAP